MVGRSDWCRVVLSRVDGLGDKLRVAMDAGARRVLIPTENSRDLGALPAEVLDKLRKHSLRRALRPRFAAQERSRDAAARRRYSKKEGWHGLSDDTRRQLPSVKDRCRRGPRLRCATARQACPIFAPAPRRLRRP
jgi:Lon protease (S16) C-terminal proteolytic domain